MDIGIHRLHSSPEILETDYPFTHNDVQVSITGLKSCNLDTIPFCFPEECSQRDISALPSISGVVFISVVQTGDIKKKKQSLAAGGKSANTPTNHESYHSCGKIHLKKLEN